MQTKISGKNLLQKIRNKQYHKKKYAKTFLKVAKKVAKLTKKGAKLAIKYTRLYPPIAMLILQ
jgi:hypothetical protein